MTTDEVKELMNKGLITQVINPTDIVNNMETEPGSSDYQLPIAGTDVLGGVKIGTGLDIDEYGLLSVTGGGGSDYELGTGLGLNADGKLHVQCGNGLAMDGNKLIVKIGTEGGLTIDAGGKLGVNVGNGLTIDADGKLNTTGGGSSDYTLPIAGTDVLGGIKVGTESTIEAGGLYIATNDTLQIKTGNGLGIDDEGKLYVTGGGSGGSDYTLGTASKETLGGVKVGTSLVSYAPIGINNAGEIGVNYGNGLGLDLSQKLEVKIGTGLEMIDGQLQVGTASKDALGGVKIGTGLDIDDDGKLYTTGGGSSDYTLGTASKETLGGVKVGTQIGISSFPYAPIGINNATGEIGLNYGDGLSIDRNGILYATGGSDYELGTASKETLGGVKVGNGLTIDENGKLHITMAGPVGNPYSKLGGVKVGTSIDSSSCPYVKIGINDATGEIGVNYGNGLKTNNVSGTHHSALEINYGDGLGIDSDGKLYVTGGGSDYELPIASESTLGGVKVGDGLSINGNGKLGAMLGTGLYMDDGGICVSYSSGLRANNGGQIVVDIDHIYEQILAKLKDDGYIQ